MTSMIKSSILRSFCAAGLLASALALGAHIVHAWAPPPNCYDFVTGGGWFTPTGSPGTDQANFGFNAGYKNGAPPPPLEAHFEFIDHNTGMKVHINGADSYAAYSCNDRDGNDCADRVITGSSQAEIDGVGGYGYSIEVVDDGEPGNVPKGHDRFRITLTNGYAADSGGAPNMYASPSDGIDGGNIQIHKSCTANPK